MSKVNEFNRENLKEFRQKLNMKMEELEAEYGIKIKLGNISFSPTEFTSKITCRIFGEDGRTKKEVSDFNTYKNALGIQFEMGDKFMLSSKQFEVDGINLNARKNMVKIKCLATGKIYATTVDAVNRAVTVENRKSK